MDAEVVRLLGVASIPQTNPKQCLARQRQASAFAVLNIEPLRTKYQSRG